MDFGGDEEKPESRCGHVAVTWNDSLYVWGGYRNANANFHYLPLHLNPRILWEYNLNKKVWIQHTCKGYVPISRLGAAAVCVKGTLVLFGGCGVLENKNDLHILKLTSPMEWKEISPQGKPPSPRNKLACFHFCNQIIYFGGYGPRPTQNQINNGIFDEDLTTLNSADMGWNNHLFAYCIEKNEWNTLQNGGETPRARAAHCCARIDNHSFMFGGRHRTSRLDDLFQLNLDSFNWTEIKRRNELAWPIGRSWHTVTRCGESCMLLLSGFDSDQNVMDDGWVYSIESQTWSKVPYIKFPRLWHSASCGVYNGQVVVFGGCSSNIFLVETIQENDLSIYDLQPKPLLRICLEASSKTTQEDWYHLPYFLQDKLKSIAGG